MYRKEEKNKEDILYILEHLRAEDKEELEKQLGEDCIQKCLNDIMAANGKTIIGYAKSDDEPVCVGGCSIAENNIGIVWLLSTDRIKNYKNCILKNIKKEIKEYEKEHLILCNIIFHKNTLAKIWLKKIGFKFENPKDNSIPDGFEFFYKKKEMRGLKDAASSAVS